MEGLFSGEIDESLPELQIFERIPFPAMTDRAVRDYYRLLDKGGLTQEQAVELIVDSYINTRPLGGQ